MNIGSNNVLLVALTNVNDEPTYIRKVYLGNLLIWEDPYEKLYLIFTALEDGLGILLKSDRCTYVPSVEYSVDDGDTWNPISIVSGTYSGNVKKGHRILVRGSTTGTSHGTILGCGTFSASAKFKVSGHPYSLFSHNTTTGITSTPSAATALTRDRRLIYASLFKGCTNLIEVSDNFLYATVITDNCYQGMFLGCTLLTKAPNLPATSHYNGINSGLRSYYRMFYNCNALRTGPEIYLSGGYSILDSVTGIFCEMFRGCGVLSSITYLGTDTNTLSNGGFGTSTGGFYNWVYGVPTTTGYIFTRASTTYAIRGVHGIPTNWTIVAQGASGNLGTS